MALTPSQQLSELIHRSQKRILVITREQAGVEAVASLVSLGLLLKKLGKHADVVAPGISLEHLPSFLSKDVPLLSDVGATRTFHIRVKTQDVPLSELVYTEKDGVLDITLLPQRHTWTPTDVSMQYGEDRYDLIITVDCPDMASLGALAREQADLFYRTPVCNIDCHANNEYWGQINLIDLKAVSSTEVIYRWMKQQEIIPDEQLATALLGGMIAETKSFRTLNVTPHTLITSSELIELGARRDEIVQTLWRTRNIATLKLWGRVLSRLETDREVGLVWSSLGPADFIESGVEAGQLDGIVDELLTYAPEAKVIALIWQNDAGITLNLHAHPPFSAAELVRPLGGEGTREQATCQLAGTPTLIEGTAHTIEQLRQAIQSIQQS